ncbi:MAG: hypothetical protein H8E13_17440 [Actinobacteria bacterium]|nr:hypothetical protein [Actinomycetota bacterium]
MKSIKLKQVLNESSLSRVWQHFNNPEITIVIFTAFRDGVEYEISMKKNKSFAATLKNNKFGYFYVNGYFPENEGTDEEVQVKEDSIFAIARKNRGNDLIALCHKLANSANQDSIIVKETSGEIYFLKASGSKDKLSKGTMSAGKLGKYYTQLRNKKVSNTFVFEGITDGKGFFQRYREHLMEAKK